MRSQAQSRAAIGASLKGAAAQIPDIATAQQWIGEHPALSMVGAFAAGALLPVVASVPAAEPRARSFWVELLGPVVQDAARAGLELLTSGDLPAALRPHPHEAPAKGSLPPRAEPPADAPK